MHLFEIQETVLCKKIVQSLEKNEAEIESYIMLTAS